MRHLHLKNERGVALLIVLLVTALLIALVFEFAYATRISLNSAVNFRDNQKAYFLALTGINAFKSPNAAKLRESFPANTEINFSPDGGTVISLKWQPEAGKIRINDVKTDQVTQAMVKKLLENKRIDTAVYDRMVSQDSEIRNLVLLSGLRQYMTEEEFEKLNANENFTVSQVAPHKIDINSASADVLESLGISADAAQLMIQQRKERAYTQQDINQDLISPINGLKIPPATGNLVKTYLIAPAPADPQIIRVDASARVGDYTKDIEAILNGSTVLYWKAL